MPGKNPTGRFTNTVEHYIKYRPSYPKEVIALLTQECHLISTSKIADIGSGTGKFSELLLSNGYTVYGIEPNKAMREAGERQLAEFPQFHSIAAQAEATTLPNHSIDLITAGQAFHWFKQAEAKTEFQRILKPNGWVALIWNMRDNETSPFMQDYEQLLQNHGEDYENSAAERVDLSAIKQFFSPKIYTLQIYRYNHVLDWEGLQGRLLSTSYTPKPGQPGYDEMIKAAEQLFNIHQNHGKIEFLYQTKVFYGQL